MKIDQKQNELEKQRMSGKYKNNEQAKKTFLN